MEGRDEGSVDSEQPSSLPHHLRVGQLFHFRFGRAGTFESGAVEGERGRGRERGGEGGREGEGEREGRYREVSTQAIPACPTAFT